MSMTLYVKISREFKAPGDEKKHFWTRTGPAICNAHLPIANDILCDWYQGYEGYATSCLQSIDLKDIIKRHSSKASMKKLLTDGHRLDTRWAIRKCRKILKEYYSGKCGYDMLEFEAY
jgi:hypothetical protein